MNWLRAGVLGANDGIVSVAGIVVGVAGATAASGPIFTAGLAGLVAGAVSMSLGEYVSVSSQRDSETAELAQEKRELAEMPTAELAELTALYEAKGLSAATARTVAAELTAHDALAAHVDAELHLDTADLANPLQAAAASALSFTIGALLPLLAILLPPPGWRVPVTFVAVLLALGIAGAVSARIGGSNVRRAVTRVVVGGAIGSPSPTASVTSSAPRSGEPPKPRIQPAKRRPGYANFAIVEPPLKLVVIEGEPDRATVLDHLGVEVATTDEVTAATTRLAGLGLATVEENDTTCCYALQDKVWVPGPGSEPREVYTVKGRRPRRHQCPPRQRVRALPGRRTGHRRRHAADRLLLTAGPPAAGEPPRMPGA